MQDEYGPYTPAKGVVVMGVPTGIPKLKPSRFRQQVLRVVDTHKCIKTPGQFIPSMLVPTGRHGGPISGRQSKGKSKKSGSASSQHGFNLCHTSKCDTGMSRGRRWEANVIQKLINQSMREDRVMPQLSALFPREAKQTYDKLVHRAKSRLGQTKKWAS